MDPIFIAALMTGLLKALEKLADKALIDPALERGLAPFKRWLARGYDEAKDGAELTKICQAALEDLRNQYAVAEPERLIPTWQLAGLKPDQLSALAAAALEMTAYDPELLSPQLLSRLGLNPNQRDLLAKFLFLLRKHLARSPRFQEALQYADEADRRGQLAGLSAQILDLQEQAQRTSSYLELLVQSRRLTSDDTAVLREYLDWARQRWSSLSLPLIRKRSGETVQAGLKQVFVPLQLRDHAAEEAARRKHSRTQRPEVGGEEAIPPLELGQLLQRYPRFILIGSPGSGKTTLLRRLGLAFAEGRANADLGWSDERPLLPVFSRLRNFGAFLAEHKGEYPAPCPGALLAFLENQYHVGERRDFKPGFFDRRLQEGGCLVLLDGLDEVSENRGEVAQYLREFINHYGQQPGNRFGLSSRPRGYESVALQLAPANLAVAEVRPLEAEGIRQLIANLFWLIESDPSQRSQDAEGLSGSILASPDLTKIAATPLFCSALVQVYKYHGARLPERRVDVLDEIVDLLLGFWRAQQTMADAERLAVDDGTGKPRRLEEAVSVKRQRLSYLAYQMQINHRVDVDTTIATDWIAAYLKERERVRDEDTACQWAADFLVNSHEHSGLLAELEPEKYSFVHKSFQEFLAATWLVNRNEVIPTTLAHLEDDWWEPILLLAGAHPRLSEGFRGDLIDELLDRFAAQKQPAALQLAGKLAVDMGETLPGPQHERVETALLSVLTGVTLPAKERAAAGRILGRLGDPRPEVMTLEGMRFCFVPQGSFWMGNGEKAHQVSLPDYWLGLHPVSNAQFAAFVKDGGYADSVWWGEAKEAGMWSEAGFKGRNDEQLRSKPMIFKNPAFSLPNHPVVGVSWYEALAFTRWLEARARENGWLPDGLRLCLPVEQEWEKAARGGLSLPEQPVLCSLAQIVPPLAPSQSDNPAPRRGYPWVGEFNKENANTFETKIGATSALGCFGGGMGPYGHLDLSGNVWEWQENWWSEKREGKGLRGGSWGYALDRGHCSFRHRSDPGGRNDLISLRCALSPRS
jgi:formylglycine-generating enzyme required for sulfatase activity